MKNPMLIVTLLSLERFDNSELAALNNAIQGFGQVQKQNLAYKSALNASFIDESGRPKDIESLKDACAIEVNRRVDAGTFK